MYSIEVENFLQLSQKAMQQKCIVKDVQHLKRVLRQQKGARPVAIAAMVFRYRTIDFMNSC